MGVKVGGVVVGCSVGVPMLPSDYFNKKVDIVELVKIKKNKDDGSKIGVSKVGIIYPMRRLQDQIKVNKTYRLYLNEYCTIIKFDEVKA